MHVLVLAIHILVNAFPRLGLPSDIDSYTVLKVYLVATNWSQAGRSRPRAAPANSHEDLRDSSVPQRKGKEQTAALDRNPLPSVLLSSDRDNRKHCADNSGSQHTAATDSEMQPSNDPISKIPAEATASYRSGGPSHLRNVERMSRLISSEAAANIAAGDQALSPFAMVMSQAAVTETTLLPAEAAAIAEDCTAAVGSGGAAASTAEGAEATITARAHFDSSSSNPPAHLLQKAEARGPDEMKELTSTVWLNSPKSAVQQLVPATSSNQVDNRQQINIATRFAGADGAAAPSGHQFADAVKCLGSHAAAGKELPPKIAAAKAGCKQTFTSPFAAPAQQVTSI